jgi:hypothetical protein
MNDTTSTPYFSIQYWKRESLESLNKFCKEVRVNLNCNQQSSKLEVIEQAVFPYLRGLCEKYPNFIMSSDLCSNTGDDSKRIKINHLYCTCYTQRIQRKCISLNKFLLLLEDVEIWSDTILLKDLKQLTKDLSRTIVSSPGYSKKCKMTLIEDLIYHYRDALLPEFIQHADKEWWDKFLDYVAKYADENHYFFYISLPALFTTNNLSTNTTDLSASEGSTSISFTQVLQALQHHQLYQSYETVYRYRDGYDLYTHRLLPETPYASTTGDWEIDHIVEQQVIAMVIAIAAMSQILAPSTPPRVRSAWQRITSNSSFLDPIT